jgi:signal peptide peptidase SppA
VKHALLAARVLGVPLLIAASKLDAILAVLGPRLGLDVPMPSGPEAEPKEQGGTKVEARIATVQVVGTLAHRVDSLSAMSGMCSYETLAAEIDRLAADRDVDGILLEVDSFGGEAAGCFDVAARVRAAREKKPVVGVASQYAMSAGYAILSQCDTIFVPQSGEVGSIGVVTTHVDRTAEVAQAGVRVTHVYAGKHKVDMSPFVGLTDEAKARLAGEVATLYDQFVSTVEQGRGAQRLSAKAARDTEALTFIGAKAVEAGLADHVGDKAAALELLRNTIEERAVLKEMQEKLAKAAAARAALQAKLAEIESRERARLEAEDAAYLEDLRKKSAASQRPIDAAKLSKIEAHLKAGRRDVAREIGDAYLEAAATAGSSTASATRDAPAAPPKAPEHQAQAVLGEKRLLERAGYKVTLAPDGSRIVSAELAVKN